MIGKNTISIKSQLSSEIFDFANWTLTAFELLFIIFLVSIPILLWVYYFYHKQPKKLAFLTFIGGILSACTIILFQKLWTRFEFLNVLKYSENFHGVDFVIPNIVIIPGAILASYFIIGIMEEVCKLMVVKIVDGGKFKCVDDAIEYSIIAALGFAFLENIIYLVNIYREGSDMQFFLLTYIYRSVFSTFAHVFFSGILGYFYGIAHFASPILQKEMQDKQHKYIAMFHKIVSFNSVSVFKKEKLLEGLIIASLLHAFFNVFLHLNIIAIVFLYIVFGFYTLNYLIHKKDNYCRLDKLTSIDKIDKLAETTNTV